MKLTAADFNKILELTEQAKDDAIIAATDPTNYNVLEAVGSTTRAFMQAIKMQIISASEEKDPLA